MSEASKPHMHQLSALKAWVEQDAEGRVMTVVEDPSIVEYVDDLVEQLEAVEQERDRISREAIGFVLKWSDRAEKAEAALQRIADLTSQEVQFAAVGGEGGVMRRIAREALNPASVGSSDKAGGAPTSPATYPASEPKS